MKSTELNKVMRSLTLPSKFIKNGRLAYYKLTHETGATILVGVYLDSSVDPNSFFVQYFVQCLYLPFSTFIFSLGDRIDGHWEISDLPEINRKLHNFNKFDKLNSFKDFIPFLEKHPYYGEGTGRNQYFALTYFVEKNFKESLKYLDKILELKNHTNPEWFKHDIQNAEQMKCFIIENSYQKGINQILKWQQETMSAIKLKTIT